MKKILMWIGALFTLLITLCIGAFLIFSTFWGKPLDESSKKYIDESIPAIASEWSPEELLKRASPELINTINKNPESLNKLFSKLQKLGKLNNYTGSSGESSATLNLSGPNSVTAGYIASVDFENGKAVVTIKLIQIDNEWKITYFYVNSPALLE